MSMACFTWDTNEDKELVEKWDQVSMANMLDMTDPEIREAVEKFNAETDANRDFQRALESTEREDFAKDQAAKDMADPEYQKWLNESVELDIGKDHQVLIKGFNVSRIDNEGTARIQALFPAIVSQATKKMEFTGKLPPMEMDERGIIWATPENWNSEEDGATGVFHRHTAEMLFGKSENELTQNQRNEVTQQQMDTQLHWNFHTIYEILFTNEDRLEVERICIERSLTKLGWEREVSEYATQRAKEGRNDEVFCECGVMFMTEEAKAKLKAANKEMYEFIGDKLKQLSQLSDFLGLKIWGGKENE